MVSEVNDLGDIRDIKNIIEIVPNIYLLLILLFLIIVLLGIIFFVFFRKKKNKVKNEKIIPALPPDVVALEMLRKLKDEQLIEQGKVKEFSIRVADIIRVFFEGTYQVYGMDRTTYEILQELKNKKISYPQIKMIQNFLDNCDLIKFAKYSPFKEELYHLLEQAEKIVEGSRENV